MKNANVDQNKQSRNVKYAWTIDCHISLFVRWLAYVPKDKRNKRYSRRYITSQQINWLKLRKRKYFRLSVLSLSWVFPRFQKTNYAARSLNRDIQAQASELGVNALDRETNVERNDLRYRFCWRIKSTWKKLFLSFAQHTRSSRARKLRKLFA